MKNNYKTTLEKIRTNISENMLNICNYHNISAEKSYSSILKVESVLDFLIRFYERDNIDDKSSKKALVMEFINNEDNTSFLSPLNIFGSSTEMLLFMSLKLSMPEKVKAKAYLMPQVKVCDDKYTLDIALMEKIEPKINDGCEGIPVIGIECNGYEYHYSNPEQATQTTKRIREIEMSEGIKVFQYTGSEIYAHNTELAEEFWEYVCNNIY